MWMKYEMDIFCQMEMDIFSTIQIHRIFLHMNDQTRETTPLTNVHSCHRPVEAVNILIIIAILLKRAAVMVSGFLLAL